MASSCPIPPAEPPRVSYIKPLSGLDGNERQTAAGSIMPTTAGLLHRPTVLHNEWASNQVSKQNYVQPNFKEELIAKQNRLTAAQNALEVPLSIDEKISLQAKKQREHLPDALLSSSRRDKSPFAYSPEVNDPNNRGKLDLSQIKSPVMRRRLLANMKSKSGDETESTDCQDGQGGLGTDTSCPPMSGPHGGALHQRDLSSMQVEHARDAPKVVRFDSPPEFFSSTQQADRGGSASANGPPAGRSQPVYQEQPRIWQQENQLDLELEKSLTSLSLLADRIGSQESKMGAHLAQPTHTEAHLERYEAAPLSTFVTTTGTTSNKRPSSNHSLGQRNRLFSSQKIGSPSGWPTYEDQEPSSLFVESANSCFSVASNRGPYTISPYYGAPLDVQSLNYDCGPSSRAINPKFPTSHNRLPAVAVSRSDHQCHQHGTRSMGGACCCENSHRQGHNSSANRAGFTDQTSWRTFSTAPNSSAAQAGYESQLSPQWLEKCNRQEKMTDAQQIREMTRALINETDRLNSINLSRLRSS